MNHPVPVCLPRCKISDIRSRHIECDTTGETIMQIDAFGYVFEDDCCYGIELTTSGIFLIEPQCCGKTKSAASKQKLSSKSPGAISRKLEKTAEKYIIGESYSGQSEDTVRKVIGLEDRVKKMQTRFSEYHAANADDVTCAVGAVMLCFSSGPRNREDAKSYFDDLVRENMSPQATPLLWRVCRGGPSILSRGAVGN